MIDVKGKTDSRTVSLMLWADRKIPKLCPVRHLLAYCYAIQIKGGFLFPGEQSLMNSEDGIYTVPVNNGVYLRRFQDTCKRLFETETRKGPWGTHTCRKTGYLFAIWDDAPEGGLLAGARHRNLEIARRYKRDARLLLHLTDVHRAAHRKKCTPEWRSIYVQDLQMTRVLTSNSVLRSSTLREVYLYFVERRLLVNRNSADFSISVLCAAAVKYVKNCTSKDRMDDLLGKISDRRLADDLRDVIDEFVAETLFDYDLGRAVDVRLDTEVQAVSAGEMEVDTEVEAVSAGAVEVGTESVMAAAAGAIIAESGVEYRAAVAAEIRTGLDS
ncbi:MAG: hypothetical protein ACREBR_02930, partial [bacterium]